MPRIARKDFNTSFFHVMCQGINKENIFESDMLKEKYILLMKKYLKDLEIDIVSYCIMTNHVHIVIHTSDIVYMSTYMKKINTEYAKFYNWYTKRVGFVFRDRFKSQPIINQKHLFQCINYIHLNPVKAGIVTKCNEYKYSSYNDFVKNKFLKESEYIRGLFENNAFFDINNIEQSSDFIDVNYNKDIVFEECVQNFCKDRNIEKDMVLEDTKLRGELFKRLLSSGHITKKDIQEKLNVSFWIINNSLDKIK